MQRREKHEERKIEMRKRQRKRERVSGRPRSGTAFDVALVLVVPNELEFTIRCSEAGQCGCEERMVDVELSLVSRKWLYFVGELVCDFFVRTMPFNRPPL